MDFSIQDESEIKHFKNVEQETKEIEKFFGVSQDRCGYPYWEIRNKAKSFKYRFLCLEGMEMYPRATYVDRFGDRAVWVYGDQINISVRDGAFGRECKQANLPSDEDTNGRMFSNNHRCKDNEGVLYFGGTVYECPISGSVKFNYSEYECPVGRFGQLAITYMDDETWSKITSRAVPSVKKYKKLSPCKSRREAVCNKSRIGVRRKWDKEGCMKGFENYNVAEDDISFLERIGLPLKKSTVHVYKRDIVRSVKRRIRRKRITKSEQAFFATILGASKLKGLINA